VYFRRTNKVFEQIVETILAVVAGYFAVGAAVSIALHARGLRRIDPSVAGAGFGFRLLITPGLIAAWPFFVRRWWSARSGSARFGAADRPLSGHGLRRVHRITATVLLILVPTLAVAAILARPADPTLSGPIDNLLHEQSARGDVIATLSDAFGELPVELRLRRDTDGTLQLEVDVASDLEIPGLVLLASDGPGGESTAFLGPLWGPGVRRFDLPPSIGDTSFLTLYSLARGQRVAELATSSLLPRGLDQRAED
jgi:hypothetical protein